VHCGRKYCDAAKNKVRHALETALASEKELSS
jgi:hypothetical protein